MKSMPFGSRLNKATYQTVGNVAFWDADFVDVAGNTDDLFVAFTGGDRLDFISHRAYGTVHGWWVIASINRIQLPVTDLQAGDLLRIPSFEKFGAI